MKLIISIKVGWIFLDITDEFLTYVIRHVEWVSEWWNNGVDECLIVSILKTQCIILGELLLAVSITLVPSIRSKSSSEDIVLHYCDSCGVDSAIHTS